jgi:hypothetical protein
MAVSENEFRVTDRRRVQASTAKPGTLGGTNYASVAAMRARLTAINPTSYTTKRIDDMTKNDMEYAIRLADDAAGI